MRDLIDRFGLLIDFYPKNSLIDPSTMKPKDSEEIKDLIINAYRIYNHDSNLLIEQKKFQTLSQEHFLKLENAILKYSQDVLEGSQEIIFDNNTLDLEKKALEDKNFLQALINFNISLKQLSDEIESLKTKNDCLSKDCEIGQVLNAPPTPNVKLSEKKIKEI